MARILFLGTCAALPAAHRTNTTLAVQPDESSAGLLIDCGGDVYGAMLRAGLGPDAIGDLLITHAHIDHIGSLPSLLESWRLGGRTTPLRIWALPEVLDVAQKLIAAFDFELTLDAWTYDVSFTSVEHDQQVMLAGIPAQIARMDHTVPSVGLRLALPSGDVVYSSDTRPNTHLLELAHGARVLITECTYLAAQAPAARISRHTTALEAGEEATACGVATLALVHIGWSPDEIRMEAAQAFSGTILTPTDGESLTL